MIVIYDHGVADGQPFIAMEYVPGCTLKELIAAGAPFSAEAAVRYASQVLDGLAAAHAVGIVHRDVKPQNLMVRDDGSLKVADFGVARSADETMLTQYGSVIGTADYISPEQARGLRRAPPPICTRWVSCCSRCSPAVCRSPERYRAIATSTSVAPAARTGAESRSAGAAGARRRASVEQGAVAPLRLGRRDESRAHGCRRRARADDGRPDRAFPATDPTRVMPPPTEVMPAPTRLAPGPRRRFTGRHGLAALGAAVALAGAVFVLTPETGTAQRRS